MTDSVTVKVNIPEFKRELQALGQRMERVIVKRALREAGKVFAAEAKSRAPVLQRAIRTPKTVRIPGALRSSIRVASSRKSRKLTPVQTVGISPTKSQSKRGIDPFYWRFLEGGWVPRGPGQKFKGGKRRRALERQRAVDGGARIVAYPFLKPAFDAVGPRALEAFNRAVAEGIAAENAKLKP